MISKINFPSYKQIFIKIKNYFLSKLSYKIQDVYRFLYIILKMWSNKDSRKRRKYWKRQNRETTEFLENSKFLPVSWSFEYTMASTWKSLFNSLRDEICFAADCSMKYYPLGSIGNKMTLLLYVHETLRLSLSFDIFKTLLLQFPLYRRVEIKCKWKWTNVVILK